jgi:uncharacterized protein YchJ
MNPNTGQIQHFSKGESVPAGFVEIKRPLTVREHTRMKIYKYAPCACGSSKTFKSCCWRP